MRPLEAASCIDYFLGEEGLKIISDRLVTVLGLFFPLTKSHGRLDTPVSVNERNTLLCVSILEFFFASHPTTTALI